VGREGEHVGEYLFQSPEGDDNQAVAEVIEEELQGFTVRQLTDFDNDFRKGVAPAWVIREVELVSIGERD